MTIEHLTKEQAEWILNDYAKIRTHSYLNGYINEHVKFQSMIRNKKIERPGCGCEFQSFADVSNSLYEQFEQQIKDIYER